MQKIKAFIGSYNEAVKDHFENFQKDYGKQLEKLSRKGNENNFFDYMNHVFDNLGETLKKWEIEPLEGLDGESPKQYIDSITDIDELMKVFRMSAVEIDSENMPTTFSRRFSEFGEKAIDALIQITSDEALLDSEEEEVSILVNAIVMLGTLKAATAVDKLVTLIYMCKESDELVLETISDALVEIGTSAVEPLSQKIKASDEISTREEYILETLSDIGSNNKSEKIFICLKDAFRRMDNKALGASYLGSYGDGRAIPALRGYVEKNLNAIDRDTFYEIAYAVEQLGGDMSDIDIHFDEDSYDEEFDEEFNEDLE